MTENTLEFARYFAVTLLGLAVDIGVGWTLIAAGGIGDLPAAAAGLGAGMVSNYLLHLRWTFRNHDHRPGLRHFARYALTTFLTLGVRFGVLSAIATLGLQAALHPALRLGISAGVSFVMSYAICRFFIFGPDDDRRVN